MDVTGAVVGQLRCGRHSECGEEVGCQAQLYDIIGHMSDICPPGAGSAHHPCGSTAAARACTWSECNG